MTDTAKLTMRGTDGYYDYHVFGRNQDSILGFKFLGVHTADGGNTALAFRIRAGLLKTARHPELITTTASKAPEGTDVIALKAAHPEAAWPKWSFSKKGDKYSSSVWTYVEEGSPHHKAEKLVANLREGVSAKNISDALYENISSGEQVLRPKAMQELLQSIFLQVAQQAEKLAEVFAEAKEAKEEVNKAKPGQVIKPKAKEKAQKSKDNVVNLLPKKAAPDPVEDLHEDCDD